MKSKYLITSVIILTLLILFWIAITEYNSNKKVLEEAAYRNFIEQLNKDKELTDQYHNKRLPKETFELSKFSLQNNFELCMNIYQSINMDNSDRYNDIINLYHRYWELSTEENPSKTEMDEMEIIYKQLLEIHKDIKE
jgi:LPS O-antigen subunit length determinant protein (WzzB/FepE family)